MIAMKRFIRDLSNLQMEGCFNPWRDTCALMDVLPRNPKELDPPAARRQRLAAHFANPAIEVLAIGEAPGFQGARYSGIAFTSERLLLEGAIPGVPRPAGRLTTRPTPWSEPSATIVWKALRELGLQNRVCLWNAFPIHPEGAKGPHSNRTPTPEELEVGAPFVLRLLDLLPRGVRLVAIGNKAAETLRGLGLEVPQDHCLRHPANGGATAFRQGLQKLFPAQPDPNALPF